MTPYEILEINKNATEDEIKSAYKKLARKYHPDLNKDTDAEENFKRVGQAYSEITSKKQPNFNSANHTSINEDFNSIFGDDMANIFGDLFSQFGHHAYAPRNQNIKIQVPITLKESILGVKKIVNLNVNGLNKQIEVNIPKGTSNNSQINYTQMGMQTNKNFPPGDLLVIINVNYPKNYSFQNGNLIHDIKINAWQALLGSKITFINPIEKEVEVEIPAGCQYLDLFKVKEQGLWNPNLNKHQDLFLRLYIEMPKLTSEQKNQLRDLTFVNL